MDFEPKGLIEKCNICNHEWIPSASKRKGRCPNCEHIERHGITLFESERRKRQETADKMRERSIQKQKDKPVVQHKINKVSKKQAVRNQKLKKVKDELKTDGLDGEFVECEGCGNYFDTIDASHTVGIPHNQGLILVKANMRRYCRQCHMDWESGLPEKLILLKCFMEDMEFLYHNHEEKFWKLYYKFADQPEKYCITIQLLNKITDDY